MEFIKIENLFFRYDEGEEDQPKNENYVIRDLSLSINKGDFVAIVGHNGSGKSTVAKHLNAMLIPSMGKVYIDGMDTADEALSYDIRACRGDCGGGRRVRPRKSRHCAR